MIPSLIIIIIIAFLGLLALNIYFRVKVLSHYKALVKNKVEFKSGSIFNKAQIEEIVKEYPESEHHIREFHGKIRFSVFIAIMLIILIAVMGGLLAIVR